MSQADLSKLSTVRALFFDVDGVFTDGSLLITENGEHLRTMNIKDGYAVKRAVDAGLHVCIISGGKSDGVRIRFQNLGVKEVYLGVQNKTEVFNNLKNKYNLSQDEILYMGDDLPDLEVIQKAGVKVCPHDAVWEIREEADFVMAASGGRGAVRELIEKVMKLQNLW